MFAQIFGHSKRLGIWHVLSVRQSKPESDRRRDPAKVLAPVVAIRHLSISFRGPTLWLIRSDSARLSRSRAHGPERAVENMAAHFPSFDVVSRYGIRYSAAFAIAAGQQRIRL